VFGPLCALASDELSTGKESSLDARIAEPFRVGFSVFVVTGVV
jgi:hypothetical protein